MCLHLSLLHLKCLFFCLHQFERKHCIIKNIADGGQNNRTKQKLTDQKTVQSKLRLRENPFLLFVRASGGNSSATGRIQGRMINSPKAETGWHPSVAGSPLCSDLTWRWRRTGQRRRGSRRRS